MQCISPITVLLIGKAIFNIIDINSSYFSLFIFRYIEGEKPTCNVFLADFIDIKNSDFCKIVVDLNEKIDLNSEIDIIDCWQITDEMEPI